MAPGTYQVGVEIDGILDLSESSGTRTVETYSQDSSGATKLALTAGAISEIVATGNAVVGGTIEIDESGNTPPQNGDMFTIVTAGALTGTFATLTVPNACQGQIYSLIYTLTKVILAVTGDCATPTPSPTPVLVPTETPTLTPSVTIPPTATPTDTRTATEMPPSTLTATQASTSTLTPAASSTQTATPTLTVTRPVLSSVTATQTPTHTPTTTPTATATPTATPVVCVGDCDGNGNVSIDELIKMVNIALGGTPPSACPKGIEKDPVTIDELISGVNHALGGGCRR